MLGKTEIKNRIEKIIADTTLSKEDIISKIKEVFTEDGVRLIISHDSVLANKIKELKDKGYSYEAIAREIGCSTSAVKYHCNDNIRNSYTKYNVAAQRRRLQDPVFREKVNAYYRDYTRKRSNIKKNAQTNTQDNTQTPQNITQKTQ